MAGDRSMLKCLIIIPCYNEAASIGRVLEEIGLLCLPVSTLVIDDCSKDNTFQVASSKSACIRLVQNLGIGGAVQTGLKYACQMGFDLAIQLDGDGQHPPAEIPLLLRAYSETGAHLMVGSRFLEARGDFQTTWARRLGIGIISRVIKSLYGKVITDPTSGFRLMDRAAIALFADEYPQDYPEPVSIALALERGMTVFETPVAMRAREFGQSSIGDLDSILYMTRVIGNLLLNRLRRNW